MDAIWYAGDYPPKHNEVTTLITGNEWLDLLIVIALLLLPTIFFIQYIERK